MSGQTPVLPAAAAAAIDMQLMNRLAAGDRDAISDLYDRHAPRIYALAYRILRNGTDAEDVVQEVFSQAWRTAGSYRAERGSVTAWLLVMARSRAIDRLRSRRMSEQALDEADYQGLASGDSPVTEDLIASERADFVQRALTQLPDDQRRALELAYFEGLSQSEIAAKLRTPLGTVKTRIRAALATLRRSLGT
jgi:RNA polymerase sigma-70 factor, ECF subfamily